MAKQWTIQTFDEGHIRQGTLIKGSKISTRVKYPWQFMEVGDYVNVPIEKVSTSRGAAYQFANREGIKFTTSCYSCPETGKPLGVSIIRVA